MIKPAAHCAAGLFSQVCSEEQAYSGRYEIRLLFGTACVPKAFKDGRLDVPDKSSLEHLVIDELWSVYEEPVLIIRVGCLSVSRFQHTVKFSLACLFIISHRNWCGVS